MNMSTFVAAAAHDMKNSVSVIAAYLEDALHELAKTDANPPSAATLSTCQALYETQRVNGNLVQLMAIYKLEEGMYPFEPAHIQLDEFAEELLGRVRPLAKLKGLELQYEAAAGTNDWVFDHDLIGSVLIQALFGAVRYARRRVRLSLTVQDERLEIEVADDGQGFPDFMLAQGFPSRQGIDVHTGSTGMGLFFARLAAGLHRRGDVSGSTRLCNGGELGGGRFTLVLP
ncbi:signal transduction histidine kinase [Pelomonas saccharophila]|uniref:histidine kinase n=1 Tax=Roseateles saccharophilus TaxID=304 RepID=A0ABU1YI58_ROSSA|nr:HAMP domain-containing sensor histidine kinase [Roseateles saccharophilus]MDR7268531.1 signal transduction histidine kinase [Roseateles saccharophilus]